MTKYIIAIVFIASLNFAFGKSSTRGSQVKRDTSIFTSELALNESVYHFNFSQIYYGEEVQQIVQYSIDGVEASQSIGSNDVLEIKTTPGKHIFQIVFGTGYKEVFTDTLEIEAQYTDVYSVDLQLAEVDVIYFKPIIYLYPETETVVNVTVDIKGKNPFFYPEYNEGWTCTASPNGDIKIGEDVYNYLFWEADGKDQLDRSDAGKGFYVAGNDAIKFLEEKLTLAGLTSKEQADFITFWGPKIQQSEHNLVQFDFNTSCDKYAELNISPKPDKIYRIYIKIAPLDAPIIVEEQEVQTINRTGFTVLEWGGQMSQQIQVNPSNI